MIQIRPGDKFHSLTFVRHTDGRARDCRMGIFACACGATKEMSLSRVVNGYSKSCGAAIHYSTSKFRHGMRSTPEYVIWSTMRSRMLNPNNKDYSRYGAVLGISPELRDFTVFLNEVGKRPGPRHSLDRIDNTKGYILGNLRWSTPSQQQSNTRRTWLPTIDGIEYESQADAARKFMVTIPTIVAWCAGYWDSGTFYHPRQGCSRRKKYPIKLSRR